MNVFFRYRRFNVIIVSTILFAVHLWTSYISFHYPYLGIVVKPTASDTWLITEFHTGSVAQMTGLQLYDEVLHIDGRPVIQHFSVPLFQSIEQAYHIEILRDDRTMKFSMYEVVNSVESRTLLLYTAELILFALAVFIYTKASLAASTRLLIKMFILMGLAFMCAEASSRADLLSIFLLFSSMSLIPLLFVHFMYQLLKEKNQTFFPFSWINRCYWIILPICLLRVIYFFPIVSYAYYSLDRLFTLICFAIGSILSLIFLIFLYVKRRHEYSYSAAIIKTMFFSFGISFAPYIVLSAIPDIFGKQIINPSYTIWFILLFPISFFYLAYRRKLFNINWTVAENRLQHLVGVLLHRKHPTLLALHELIRGLRKVQKRDDLQKLFLPDLCTALGIKYAAIYINDYNSIEFLTYGEIDIDEIEKAIESECYPTAKYHIFDIEQNEDYSCYFIIERTNRRLSVVFQQWLETIRSPLSLVIENLHLSNRLSIGVTSLIHEAVTSNENPMEQSLWMNKFSLQLQEQERSRIASDLHDTILQDIYFAKQRILAIPRSRMNPVEIKAQLEELAEFLGVINLNAREATFQLYPHLLKDTGFAEAISNLVETERGRASFHLYLQIEDSVEWDKQPTDVLLQLFRITQELLTNARKHSNASIVRFHYYKSDSAYIIHYSDDGIGMDHKSQDGTMGWLGIRQRIASIGASLQVNSTRAEGLTVIITLNEE